MVLTRRAAAAAKEAAGGDAPAATLVDPAGSGEPEPSAAGGAMILGGTAVGAGMLAMPLEAAEVWYTNAMGALLVCWLGMNLSARMILESNLYFDRGASFETFAPVLLNAAGRAANTLSVLFVHFILTYAYISGGGGTVASSLAQATGGEVTLSPALARVVFAGTLALAVVHGSHTVERLSTLMMLGMGATFVLSMSGLLSSVSVANLLDSSGAEDAAVWGLPPVWRPLPSFLTAFGVHGNMPSMMKHYGKKPAVILSALNLGLGCAFATYFTWLTVVLGVLGRPALASLAETGGADGLLEALGAQSADPRLIASLQLFGNLALASSFLGVGLGLFDFVADGLGSSNRPLV